MIRLARYRQRFPRPRVEDVAQEVRRQMRALHLAERVEPGTEVAITAGSRGIAGIPVILREVAGFFKHLGASPFFVAAMGSHGGGTAEGQRQVLRQLGITEEAVGAPVRVAAEAELIGEAPGGYPVYCDALARRAGAVFVVNRVKPHTAFRGSIESGLLKMLAVGLGKGAGAAAVHRAGPGKMEQAIRAISGVLREKLPVVGGLAIVENGYDETAQLCGLGAGELEREAQLLEKAKSLLPRLPVEDVDVLIVEEMGKNISGTGMDVNVIGRWRIQGVPEPPAPRVRRLVVLDLTKESEGNANGIGLADFTTRRLVNKIDFRATYLNAMTTGYLMRAMLPLTFETDREAVAAALQSLSPAPPGEARVILIRNTLRLEEFYASPALEKELLAAGAEMISPARELVFDGDGNLLIDTPGGKGEGCACPAFPAL